MLQLVVGMVIGSVITLAIRWVRQRRALNKLARAVGLQPGLFESSASLRLRVLSKGREQGALMAVPRVMDAA